MPTPRRAALARWTGATGAEWAQWFLPGIPPGTPATPLCLVCGDAYDAFQVLGYDFMPDENGKVWLLEVNGSPAAAERMTPTIAEDLVELAVDAKFPPRGGGRGEKGAVASGRWVELDLACA